MAILTLLFTLFGIAADVQCVASWDFQTADACHAWQANAHFTDVVCESGRLNAKAVDWDPFFICSEINFSASPAQYVHLRLRASAGGKGQLFWTGQTEGKHGGFDPAKVTDFEVAGGDIEDIYIFPYWHSEKAIRKLRLDLYDGALFEIHEIAVLEDTRSVQTDADAWSETSPLSETVWRSFRNNAVIAAPPLAIPVDSLGWVSFVASADRATTLSLYWSTDIMSGGKQETVYIQEGQQRCYHVELQGYPQWAGVLVGMHFELPAPEAITLESVVLADEPAGPPVLEVTYFGFENGVSRAGRDEVLLALFTNTGGGEVFPDSLSLKLPEAILLADGPAYEHRHALRHGDMVEVRWRVKADAPGSHSVVLEMNTIQLEKGAILEFSVPVTHAVEYVPPPRPLKTSRDILAYYFPGWNADAKWDCIRTVAPIRRPLLGYYDEANVECVDWQIKWAVENGIRGFLVDWYWSAGAQSLLHWFEAYRQARYRDFLEVAIMWANHNAPGTHSREDWRAVTREWIEQYFTLNTYSHVDGMPAVYIWDAHAIRTDLGGSEEAAAALAESQDMAQAAGHKGIAFIALQHHITETDAALLEKEGYHGQTSYHEWGDAMDLAAAPSLGRFYDIVATAPAAWEKRRSISEGLLYVPVVDTGWDSRPWHGSNARAFHGRTVEGFRALLESARDYAGQHDTDAIILGPLNEWGEGSYIEPNLEFGFGMYEAIREVFGLGESADWPENLSPRDVGLGPYEFPAAPRTFTWTFEDGAQGWAAMMNVANFRADEGRLCFESTSRDPALVVATGGLHASRYPRACIRMRITGTLPESPRAQLFWTIGANPTSEASSLNIPLQRDGAFHDYELDLAAHPRWRGRISTLRFDPCDFIGAEVCVDSFVFLEE